MAAQDSWNDNRFDYRGGNEAPPACPECGEFTEDYNFTNRCDENGDLCDWSIRCPECGWDERAPIVRRAQAS